MINDFIDTLSACKDFDLAILKAHIFTEHAIEQFIESKSIEKIDMRQSRFSYYNKIEIAKILGLYKNKEIIYKKLQLLNKLRNSIAHSLKHDKNILKEFLKDYDETMVLFKKVRLKDFKIDELVTIKSIDEVYKIKSEQVYFCVHVAFIYAYIAVLAGLIPKSFIENASK